MPMNPISPSQERYILGMAEDLLVDYEGPEDLDRRVIPIYGCSVAEMNSGQASMLIDDMRAEQGDFERPSDVPTIFD